MRIALIADIHGNLLALEAALEDIRRYGADQLVVLGDIVVGGPDSAACWERVKSLRCPVLRGNHERYVVDLGTERAKPEWKTRQFGPVQYAAAQLGPVALQELTALPMTLRMNEFPDLLFTHASARNDSDLVFPYTPDAELEPMFKGAAERWLLRGHNHFAAVRLWGDRRIVTVGSVGLPLDGSPSAQYTLLVREDDEWQVVHRIIPYDVEAAVRRFADTGYLAAAGPMARLYQREVLTAAFQIIPFLAFYRRISVGQTVDLEEAMRRFYGEVTS
jgi:predicted phosphodiesterase